ncbi:MAG: hypothetical protein J5995_07155 [Muribaculaceae bacterium]|nr:hypothetical protein [Muribaculaceae bacterium]
MNKSIITFAILFIVLVLAQALIMNHIVLFHYAVCFVFIYFIVKLPLNVPANWALTFGFLLGLSVDMLSDTPGVNALGCTILTAMKRPIYFAYEQHDDKNRNIEPGMWTMGWLNFSKYLLSMSALYCITVTLIESVNYESPAVILIKAGASTVFTFLMLTAIDSLQNKK